MSSLSIHPGSQKVYAHTLTETESKDLHKLVTQVGTKSIFWLGWNMKKLEGYKDRLGHIHPLTFIQNIFTNKALRPHVKGIRAHGDFVWKPFTKNLQKCLDEEAKLGNLHKHIEAFSREIKCSAETVAKHLESRTIGQFLVDQLC